MIIALFGESCTGKSTIADALKEKLNADVYTGKDYLKMAKSEIEAQKLFAELLENNQDGGKAIIYVISEKEHLTLLPERAVRVLFTAELDVIKERFAQRMHGNLPAPVAAMLEKKHGMFDGEAHVLRVETGKETVEEICGRIMECAGAQWE